MNQDLSSPEFKDNCIQMLLPFLPQWLDLLGPEKRRKALAPCSIPRDDADRGKSGVG